MLLNACLTSLLHFCLFFWSKRFLVCPHVRWARVRSLREAECNWNYWLPCTDLHNNYKSQVRSEGSEHGALLASALTTPPTGTPGTWFQGPSLNLNTNTTSPAALLGPKAGAKSVLLSCVSLNFLFLRQGRRCKDKGGNHGGPSRTLWSEKERCHRGGEGLTVQHESPLSNGASSNQNRPQYVHNARVHPGGSSARRERRAEVFPHRVSQLGTMWKYSYTNKMKKRVETAELMLFHFQVGVLF